MKFVQNTFDAFISLILITLCRLVAVCFWQYSGIRCSVTCNINKFWHYNYILAKWVKEKFSIFNCPRKIVKWGFPPPFEFTVAAEGIIYQFSSYKNNKFNSPFSSLRFKNDSLTGTTIFLICMCFTFQTVIFHLSSPYKEKPKIWISF